MSIQTLRDGETLTIIGIRELHALNWNQIMNELVSRLEFRRTRTVDVDLSEAQFMDSFGVDSLRVLERLVRQGRGILRVKNPSTLARSILAANEMQHLIAASIPLVDPRGSTVMVSESVVPHIAPNLGQHHTCFGSAQFSKGNSLSSG